MPEVSVVMSVYKESSELLSASIESILNQTYSDYEFLIVLDNPDNTEAFEIIRHYSVLDDRIVFLINESNIGLPLSLNKAIARANGKYIARMDADDISFPHRLEAQLDYLLLHELDLIGGSMCRIDENGNVIERMTNPSYPSNCINKLLLFDDCVPHPTWFAKKQLFIDLNGYRNFFACEDYDFLLRALKKKYKIGMCDSVVLSYRVNANSISNQNTLKQRLSSQYLRRNYYCIEQIDLNSMQDYIGKRWSDVKAKDYYDSRKELNKTIELMHEGKMPCSSLIKCFNSNTYIVNDCIRMVIMRVIKVLYR